MPLSFQVSMGDAATAQFSAPPSEPAPSGLLRLKAMGRGMMFKSIPMCPALPPGQPGRD